MNNNAEASSSPSLNNAAATSPAWFCLRSQPKREHIAAAHLKNIEGVEVFNPRLRIRRPTRRGPVTFVEALFPNYLFARFDLSRALNCVKHAPNVTTVVHFGQQIPSVPDDIILGLRAELEEGDIRDHEDELKPGAEVKIGQGPLLGMRAVVLRILDPQQRVEVLMEMLGRSTPVALNPGVLILEE